MDRNDELPGSQRSSACIGSRDGQRKAAFKTRGLGNAAPARSKLMMLEPFHSRAMQIAANR